MCKPLTDDQKSRCEKQTGWLRYNSVILCVLFALVLCLSFCQSTIIPFCELKISVSALIIGIVDIYLLTILLYAAYRSDTKARGQEKSICLLEFFMPSRVAGLIIFMLIAASIIFCFGNIYSGLGNNSFVHSDPYFDITKANNSDYFSMVTITTVGYGDVAAKSSEAKTIVMLELGSGILLLAAALGLLISRLSSYGK